MEPVTIPKHIDDPVTLLVWSADEFAPAAFMLILGILKGNRDHPQHRVQRTQGVLGAVLGGIAGQCDAHQC